MLQLIDSIDKCPWAVLLTEEAKLRANDNIRKVRERWQNVQPDAFINGLFTRANGYSQYADLQRVRIWDRNLKYSKGNHLGAWDTNSPWWIAQDPSTFEGLYRNNLYGYFIRSVEALWNRQNVEITFKARSDNPDAVGAAKIATEVHRDYRSRHWGTDTELKDLEAKFAQITGNWLRRIFFASKSKLNAFRPKVEEIPVTGEDEGYLCNECGLAGPQSNKNLGSIQAAGLNTGAAMPPMIQTADGSFCPGCGSHELDYFGLPPMTISMVTGREQFDPGDVVPEVVDPSEWTMHLHSQSLEFSPYGIRKRLFMAEILEAHFPWANVPRSMTTDLRLIYQRLSQIDPGSNYNFLDDGGLHQMAELEEGWFEPAMYAHYVTPANISGDIYLEPNTAMIEKYPDGFYCQRIAGKIVDGPWPADKSKEWIHGRFDVVPQNIWGRGQDDALAANERLEEEGSLAFEIAMHEACSRFAINQLKIDQNTVGGNPRFPIKMLNPEQGDNPQSFVWQAPSVAGSGIGALQSLMAFEQENMQKLFSAFDSLTGASGPRKETATRTAILRDQATQMHASPLGRKTACDVKEANIVLYLYQKHWQGVRVLFTEGQYDDAEAKYFSRANIQGDLEAVAKAGSSLPRGEAERRAGLIEAGAFGGVEGGIFNPMWPAEVRRFVLTELGVQLDVDKVAPDWRKQMLEIRKLQELLPMVVNAFQQTGEPVMYPPGMPSMMGPTQEETPNEQIAMFLARKIPVEIARPPAGTPMPNGMMADGVNGPGKPIDNAEVHIACCNAWLQTDDGMNAHPVLRRAIMIHMQDHVAAQGLGNMWAQMIQITQAAPMLALQAAQNRPQGGSDDERPQRVKRGARKPGSAQPSGDKAQRRLPGNRAGMQQ